MILQRTIQTTLAIAAVAAVGALVVTKGSAEPARGSSYEVTSYTVDCGGGDSTSGSYELSGTIGQPDAHAMSSASYDLQGGFWMGGVIENCPADLANNDGLINVFDLFVLLGNWSTSGEGADLAPAENVVDVFDLFVLLGAWGACP